jgi:hypothetical protein
MKRLALLFLALSAGGISASPTQIQSLQQIKTVFVIALENHDWTQHCPDCIPQQIYGNPAAPYINSLVTPGNSNAAQVSYATAYYAVTTGEHPSEPNYVWSEAGTDFGVHTDNDPSTNWGNLFSSTNHLCSQLNRAGIVWKDYQEDVQYTSAANVTSVGTRPSGTNIYNGGTEYYYAVKHNPMEFFTDTQNQNVYPLAQLWTDLSSNAAGRYNWILPDEYNEMHSGLPNGFNYQGVQYIGDQAAIAEGDNCLSTIIPNIMASSAYQDHGVIIIWSDETESSDNTNTTLVEIIISPMAKGNAYASKLAMSHNSDLKTMDEIFGLAFQNDGVASSNDLSDMFEMKCSGPVISWSFTNLTLTAETNGFADMIEVTGTNYILASDSCDGSALTITQTPPRKTPLAAGTTNQVVIAVTDIASNTVYSTNWIVAANLTAPAIVSQPTNQTNDVGTSASFKVGAEASKPLSYQWYLGRTGLTGETNSTLGITSVGPKNAGQYHVVVTSAGAGTSSANALLTVVYPVPYIMGGELMPGAGGFQLTFYGTAGLTYEVLASDDLAVPQSAWTVVGSGTFGSGGVLLTDSGATNRANRFYTVKSP